MENKNKANLIFDYNFSLINEEYIFKVKNRKVFIYSLNISGFLYGFFYLLKKIQLNDIKKYKNYFFRDKPDVKIRMFHHLDNVNGSISNGFSGNSIFFFDNKVHFNLNRIRDYCRLLVSIGINSICINNTNVDFNSAKLITYKWFFQLQKIYNIFFSYNIKIYLSVSYFSPLITEGIFVHNSFDIRIKNWWLNKVKEIYKYFPFLGGFVVNANTIGLLGKNHVEKSKPIADALNKYNGILFWCCSINYKYDWRKRKDKACVIYNEYFKFDGLFSENVILQIKNGPIGEQIREPVSPLFGSIKKTSQIIEFQLNQEYTGQKIDLCWLYPQWKNVLDFDSFFLGKGSTIKKIISGKLYNFKYFGATSISDIGDSWFWTGNFLSQLNIFSFGKLLWNLDINIDLLLDEWIFLSFYYKKNNINLIKKNVKKIVNNSYFVYEKYTTPLGLNGMVDPKNNYLPNIDGYEYSSLGIYHFSDNKGIGFNRTKTGSNFVNQYHKKNIDIFNNVNSCPEDLILFFHHLPYNFFLKKYNKNIIEYIYDSHFKGVKIVYKFIILWNKLKNLISPNIFKNVKIRLIKQYKNSCNWRDLFNTYFFRKTGIKDKLNRKIYN